MSAMTNRNSEIYDTDFFAKQREGSRRAAEVVAERVVSLVKPASVVDVGCGVGTWAQAFFDCGVSQVYGIDGEWVDKSDLAIQPECFKEADLTGDWDVAGTFDLAVCLEVAEHLPPERSRIFIKQLCDLAPVILFSAAIPGQLGVNHINERWQHEWVEIFDEVAGYSVIDILRWEFWMDDRIPVWYRQNMLMFVRNDAVNNCCELAKACQRWIYQGRSVVHPSLAYPRFQMASETLENKGFQILAMAAARRLCNKLRGRY